MSRVHEPSSAVTMVARQLLTTPMLGPRPQVARAVDAPGANSSAYCKYDNQGLQAFTSVLFLVR